MDDSALKGNCVLIINRFLQDICYRCPDIPFDYTLKSRVEGMMKAHGLSAELIARIQPYTDTGVNIAINCYAHTSQEVQDIVALFTSYAITIDDLGYEFLDEKKRCVSQLLRGEPQTNVILRAIFQCLADSSPVFGQFGGDMIAKSTVDFVCGCYLELEREDLLRKNNKKATAITSHKTTPEFAKYLRIKTGVAEAYAFFLFPENLFLEDQFLHAYLPAIPHIATYFEYTNDLLSFYKEAHEQANLISNHAKSENVSTFESLELIRKKTVETFHTINEILSPNKALQEPIEQFMHGYVTYHFCSRRYRLSELDIPEVDQAKRLLFGKTDPQVEELL